MANMVLVRMDLGPQRKIESLSGQQIHIEVHGTSEERRRVCDLAWGYGCAYTY